MLPPDLPSLYMFFKKVTTGNPLIKFNSENIFFAFTDKAVEDVALNKYSSFTKSGGFKRLRSVLGDGLFTGEEPRHMEKKKEIYTAFNNDHINEYENKIVLVVDDVLSNWFDKVDVRNEMRLIIFKSVMEIFFSENIDDEFSRIQKNVYIVSDKIAQDVQDEELDRLTKELKDIIKKVVDKRLASKEIKNDFLGILVNSYNNNKMEINDLYDESLTILLGSYETTAYALEWAVYYLSINKDWQETISKGENTDAFINEVLRMCPPIWNSERIATEDVIIDGKEIPAGTQVVLSSLAVQRDKNVFEDPDTFKPERWFDNKQLSKGEYFPFLFGKRQCIGKEFALMEMRIVLTKIAKKFDLELINDQVSYVGGMSYRPKDPISIYVKNK
jgi:cytochrome P450